MSSTLGYSEIDNENDNHVFKSESLLDKKRDAIRSNNGTRKRREGFSGKKVTSELLEDLHNKNDDDDEPDAFTLPQSSGIERIDHIEKQKQDNIEKEKEKQLKENMVNMTSKNDLMFRTLGNTPQPLYEGETKLELNDYSNYGDEKSNEDYYKRVIPGYQIKDPHNKPYYKQANYQIPSTNEENILLQKMNYMITLLEDQQDERTNNVTEEVILYSFLGIFIIFVADTFVRAGKYVR